MIDYIRYTIDGKIYELTNNKDGTWSRSLNAPNIAGKYDLLLEIGQENLVTYIDSKDPRYTFYLEVINEIEKNVDLIKYLPESLQDIKEFNLIFDSEDGELDILYDEINNINLDIFIRTASPEKIRRLESFLKIKGLGTLEQRKTYLLALFQKSRKLNEKIIREIVDTITGSDCIITFFGADESNNPQPGFGLLKVQVLSPDNNKDYRYEDIFRSIKPLSPAHIMLSVDKYFSTWGDIKMNFMDWNTLLLNMQDWDNVRNYIPPRE